MDKRTTNAECRRRASARRDRGNRGSPIGRVLRNQRARARDGARHERCVVQPGLRQHHDAGRDAHARCSGVGAAGCLRQSRQHDAGPRRKPSPRDRHPRCPRSGARPAGRPTPHRERRSGACRRSFGHGARHLAVWSCRAVPTTATHRRHLLDGAGLACAPVHDDRGGDHRRGVRSDSGTASLATRPGSGAQRHR